MIFCFLTWTDFYSSHNCLPWSAWILSTAPPGPSFWLVGEEVEMMSEVDEEVSHKVVVAEELVTFLGEWAELKVTASGFKLSSLLLKLCPPFMLGDIISVDVVRICAHVDAEEMRGWDIWDNGMMLKKKRRQSAQKFKKFLNSSDHTHQLYYCNNGHTRYQPEHWMTAQTHRLTSVQNKCWVKLIMERNQQRAAV